jgi:hypothetical protein
MCGWAVLGEHGRRAGFKGGYGTNGRTGLGHDMTQFAVEGALGLRHGFWGCLAEGASFRSIKRRPPTKRGVETVRRHVPELDDAEMLALRHVDEWQRGDDGPVSRALADLHRRWQAVPPGGHLDLEWPPEPVAARQM